jgi:tetrahydromethanopterin S-methyltransferase subunit E
MNCCKFIAFFGILFYVCTLIFQIFMGIIVLTQSKFLKFGSEIDSTTDSGVACFIAAIIEVVILILLIVWDNWGQNENVSRENYIPFDSERERPRESTFKGIAMGEINMMKEQKQQEELL